MDSLNFEILAQETLALVGNNASLSCHNLEARDSLAHIDATAGVLYRIEKSSGTFSIRGLATKNLRSCYQDYLEGLPQVRTALRLGNSETEVYCFNSSDMALAEVASEQLINRRFPIDEDMICNVSDPGFSWWMESLDEGLRIYFQSYGINRVETKKQLGPLGDAQIARLRMGQLEKLIRTLFPVNEFSITPKSIVITSSDIEHPNFIKFKKIFEIGVNHFTEDQFGTTVQERTLFYYLKEIAAVRSFWRQVRSCPSLSYKY